jgi:UDP-N-acetylmuramyl pentapeptide phosphotransferase/UDP-N-acetylglucosamine-1-phosphate transferase
MITLIVSFVLAVCATLLLVRSAERHAHLSNDHDFSGPQKFHSTPVPRVGGLGVAAGILGGGAVLAFTDWPTARLFGYLLLCALPTFVSGLAEDVTKNVSPRRRLVFTAVSALLAIFVIDAVIDRFGFAPIDKAFTVAWFAAAVTVFAITGVTNAVNIIDGFNGLASMCVVMMLAAIGYVAFQVGDRAVLGMVLATAGAVIGFFLWNFPRGLIFLGDGGAYFLGFMVSELAVLLIHRNRSVSAMFPLLLCIYPIFETVFSIYRKKVIRKMSPGVPDGVHLHMLVYKRLMRRTDGATDAEARTRRNSMTSPYLWGLCLLAVIPAILFWRDSTVLLACIVAFGFIYTTLYWKIVRFRAPRWLLSARR